MDFSGPVAVNYFEVICWPSRGRCDGMGPQVEDNLPPELSLHFALVREPQATVTYGFLRTGSCHEIVVFILFLTFPVELKLFLFYFFSTLQHPLAV